MLGVWQLSIHTTHRLKYRIFTTVQVYSWSCNRTNNEILSPYLLRFTRTVSGPSRGNVIFGYWVSWQLPRRLDSTKQLERAIASDGEYDLSALFLLTMLYPFTTTVESYILDETQSKLGTRLANTLWSVHLNWPCFVLIRLHSIPHHLQTEIRSHSKIVPTWQQAVLSGSEQSSQESPISGSGAND